MALKEVQTALDRIQSYEHITGYICITSTGVPIKSTFDEEYTRHLVTNLHPFLDRIKRTIQRTNLKDLTELRLTTKKFVYLLGTDHLYSFIVVQKHQKTSETN